MSTNPRASGRLIIWLVTVGEPLPILSPGARLWRTGILASTLAARGHDVIWWTSRFDHFRKQVFESADPFVAAPNLRIRFLEGAPYARNISFRRLLNHYQIARHFRRSWRGERRPDIIVCSFPTIELSNEAGRIARDYGIPLILDIRDLWPDIIVARAPRALRWLGRTLLSRYFALTRESMRGASALIAVSEGYLQWGLRHAQRSREARDLVVPLGYSLPDEQRPERERARREAAELGADPGGILCVFSGTFGRTYDLGPVLQAAMQLERLGARFSFIICGDGERAGEWRTQAVAARNVVFTGWLDQKRIHSVLAASDIGLAAYAAGAPQGIPNKVIEYMAAGLPVLSSLAGECAELLKATQTGLTYDAGDVRSLVRALLDLSGDEHRLRLARNARATFEERFRAESVYSSLADQVERWAQCVGGKEWQD